MLPLVSEYTQCVPWQMRLDQFRQRRLTFSLAMVFQAEKKIEDWIEWVIKTVKANLGVLVVVLGVVAAVFHKTAIAFLSSQFAMVSNMLSSGISSTAMGVGMAVGVASGLGPPGLTMPVALPLMLQLARALHMSVSSEATAVAVAVNGLLSPVDLAVWASLYMKLGSRILPGGRYLRPFLAGSIPWLASTPLLLFGIRHLSSLVY